MPSALDNLFTRLEQTPRAGRWLVYTVAAVVLVNAWYYLIVPTAEEWNSQADGIVDNARIVRESESLAEDYAQLDDVIKSFGPVSAPEADAEGRKALAIVWSEIQRENNFTVSNDTLTLGQSKKMPAGLARRFLNNPEGQDLYSLSGELQFEAKPEVAIAVITELERHPEIEAITDVRLTIAPGDNLRVRLSLESWVVRTKVRRTV